jgi:hypothetical protein
MPRHNLPKAAPSPLAAKRSTSGNSGPTTKQTVTDASRHVTFLEGLPAALITSTVKAIHLVGKAAQERTFIQMALLVARGKPDFWDSSKSKLGRKAAVDHIGHGLRDIRVRPAASDGLKIAPVAIVP